MTGYWIRHRLIFTLILSGAMAAIIGLLFVFPYVSQKANDYNSQSIYKNSNVDFIVPEPSVEQVAELPGTNGIDTVFPFYMTKMAVDINGSSRTTTVLLSDQFQNIENTMYSANRLIDASKSEFENPICVDWQFCNETSAKIGDTVSITIGGNKIDYKISAIYETNTVYDGGAILVEITDEQKNSIMQNSKNSGYSGAYISASDYNACRNYLITDYRPLGRLKDISQFEDEAQYMVHYDAIMSSSYANEITDFRIRENELGKKGNDIMLWLSSALMLVAVIAFNILMSKRGCERVYFTKHCIPKGQNVKPYYSTSFVMETILLIVATGGIVIYRISSASEYIPKSAIDIKIMVVLAAIVIAEIVALIMNNAMLSGITKKVKKENASKK
ncbi:MAG: hypothetical protein MJZ11_08900 [Lachnospiraceae bacterium]|nr:hypothetical protein [Lachnospiraceae bacterium]